MVGPSALNLLDHMLADLISRSPGHSPAVWHRIRALRILNTQPSSMFMRVSPASDIPANGKMLQPVSLHSVVIVGYTIAGPDSTGCTAAERGAHASF
jgi:hypothetical protein